MIPQKYSDIVKENNRIKEKLSGTPYKITILSNITVAPLKEILEYCLRLEKINADIQFGNYDNIVQDSIIFKNSNLVIVFWESSNLIEGFHYKANCMSIEEINQVVKKIQSEIDYVFSELQETSLVLFNKFSSAAFNSIRIEETPFDKICRDLNSYIMEKAPRNVKIVDIDKILTSNSVGKSIDFRYYYSLKSLYTLHFLKKYSYFIKSIVLAANGKSKKVLIFDCDNTLWKGIVGEDGFEGIECSEKTKTGSIFQEVQYAALELSKKGVIIGLCSKNNPEDVINILKNHPDMVLKEQNITIMKLNWNDKVSNLQEIAQKLNIGLDSIVFVDDSDFEVNYVRQNLPQVITIQVPKNLYDYPGTLKEVFSYFFNISMSYEDTKKTEQYQQQFKREDERKHFENIEDYLKSLDLMMEIFTNQQDLIPRIAQLTQKTNQFNLTTKRYTEADIQYYTHDSQTRTFAYRVLDHFGDYGITGLCIVKLNSEKQSARIDTFLMSCRVIGRNIEYKFFNFLVEYLKSCNIKTIETEYIRTQKNSQVEKFYENLGFQLIHESGNEKEYILKIENYIPKNIDYIMLKK